MFYRFRLKILKFLEKENVVWYIKIIFYFLWRFLVLLDVNFILYVSFIKIVF